MKAPYSRKGVDLVFNLVGTYCEEAGDNPQILMFKTNQKLFKQ